MKHKHADLMAAYAADAQTTDRPWELWERESIPAVWVDCNQNPMWNVEVNYRRKPNTTPIQYIVSCTSLPIKAVSPDLAAQKFREAFKRDAVIVQVQDCDGLVHCYLPSGEVK